MVRTCDPAPLMMVVQVPAVLAEVLEVVVVTAKVCLLEGKSV